MPVSVKCYYSKTEARDTVSGHISLSMYEQVAFLYREGTCRMRAFLCGGNVGKSFIEDILAERNERTARRRIPGLGPTAPTAPTAPTTPTAPTAPTINDTMDEMFHPLHGKLLVGARGCA